MEKRIFQFTPTRRFARVNKPQIDAAICPNDSPPIQVLQEESYRQVNVVKPDVSFTVKAAASVAERENYETSQLLAQYRSLKSELELCSEENQKLKTINYQLQVNNIIYMYIYIIN